MQKELDGLPTQVEIHILGVNGQGLESGNAGITAERTIPWLQDTESQNVWTAWAVTYRDVVVLDGQNFPVAVYNLTEHDLANSTNYDNLKQLLVDTANAQ
jgi:hypothetical protein